MTEINEKAFLLPIDEKYSTLEITKPSVNMDVTRESLLHITPGHLYEEKMDNGLFYLDTVDTDRDENYQEHQFDDDTSFYIMFSFLIFLWTVWFFGKIYILPDNI